MTKKSNAKTVVPTGVPDAFKPAQIAFVPVPLSLSRWLHSIWFSDNPHCLPSQDRCYPDGGVSLTFTLSDHSLNASVLFSTRTAPFVTLPGDALISIRFLPGAFTECFGIPAESLPRDAISSFASLHPNEPLPVDEVCAAPACERVGILLQWLTQRLHQNSAVSEDRERLISNLATPLQHNTDIARQLGVSSRTLQRTCKRVLGLSPKELVQFSRIYTARQQLIYSSGSLADVALTSGYFDQAHFTNLFHQFVGETPAAYRQRKVSRFSNIKK